MAILTSFAGTNEEQARKACYDRKVSKHNAFGLMGLNLYLQLFTSPLCIITVVADDTLGKLFQSS